MSVLISGIYLVHFKYSAKTGGFSSYALLVKPNARISFMRQSR